MYFRMLVTLSAVAMLATPAFAIDDADYVALAKRVDDLKTANDAKLVAAEERLQRLERELTASRTASNFAADKLAATEERLKRIDSDLSVFRDASGFVAAFERDKTRPCPSGWGLFEPAGGRFIVGAGDNSFKDVNGIDLTDHSVGVVGGEERHKLTEAEMPNHRHAIARSANEINDHVAKFVGDTAMANRSSTDATGGDQPHNTMPPFVALYYCIKE